MNNKIESLLADSSIIEKNHFAQLYNKSKKSTLVAYILFFLSGVFGLHKFYLKQKRWGVIYISIVIICGILIFLWTNSTLNAIFQFGNGFPYVNEQLTNGTLCVLVFLLFAIIINILLLFDLATLYWQTNKLNLHIAKLILEKTSETAVRN